MGALFVKPMAFTVVSANEAAIAPASNANLDHPALVYRSSNLTTVNIIIDLGSSGASYDTVAIIGSNLRSTDTVQVRTGTTSTGTGNYAGTALAAFSGSLPTGSTSKAIYQIGTRTERYLRIDITATSHPDGYVSAQRIVIGKALSLTGGAGIDLGVEQGFVDQSVPYSGDGWTSFDAYQVLHQMKLTVSMIADSDWRSDWFSFFQTVGKNRAFLMVPDTDQPASWQSEAIFGRVVSDATSSVTTYGTRRAEIVIRSLAQ